MAVKLEAFLTLEKSMSQRLSLSWKRQMSKTVSAIDRLVKAGEFEKARRIIDADLTMVGVVKRNAPYVRLVTTQALLFGTSRITPPAKRKSFKDGVPPQVPKAVSLLAMSLDHHGTERISVRAHAWVTAAEERQRKELESRTKEEQVEVEKADAYTLPFQSFVDEEGNAIINTGASLHNSRMAQYGFLIEASVTAITHFQVTEQLDSRTCPICENMHGRIFPVDHALKKVEMWLSVTDPDELKAVAPWPKQDKESLQSFRNMSSQDLMRAGWDTPPYHPLCRGQLTPVVGEIPVEVVPPVVLPVVPQPTLPLRAGDNVSLEELDERIRQIQAEHIAALSEEEKQAIIEYTNFQYDEMNKILRGNMIFGDLIDPSDEYLDSLNDLIDRVESAIRRAPGLPTGVVAYRGGRLPKGVTSNNMVGATVTDPAFKSTSLSQEKAVEFIPDKRPGRGRPVMFEIEIPPNVPGVASYVDPLSSVGGEYELLLAADAEFKVIGKVGTIMSEWDTKVDIIRVVVVGAP